MTEQQTERELYNATDGPLPIDRAGRMLGAHERMPLGELDVDVAPLSGHIKAEAMVLVDPLPADEDAEQPTEQPTEQPAKTKRARTGASTQEA